MRQIIISVILFFFIFFSGTQAVYGQSNRDKIIQETANLTSPRKALLILDSISKLNNLKASTRLKLNSQLVKRYMDVSDFAKITKLSIESIQFAKAHNLDSLAPFFHLMIGNSQYMNQKFDECLVTYKYCEKLAEKYKNYKLIASCNNNMGGLFVDRGEFVEAEKHLKKAIEISKQTGESRTYILSSRILASSYEKQNLNDKALNLFEKIEKEAIILKDDYVLSSVLVYYGQLLHKFGNSKKGLEKIKKAQILLRKQGDLSSLAASLEHEASILHKLKHFEEESLVLKEYISLKQKIFTNENQKQINQLETKFKTKQISQEKKIAEAKTLAEMQQKNNYLYVLLLVVFVSIIVFLIIFLRNSKKSAQVKLQFQEERLASIIEGQENERTRIAKELHDGIVQDLTVLKMNLLKDKNLNQVEEDLTKISKEVRELSYQMMPVSLRNLGLIEALEELFERSFTKNGIAFEFEYFEVNKRLSDKIEVSIYRICQELINNTLKHAKATEISIVLRKVDNQITFIFEDNGLGFDSSHVKLGIGLQSLHSRIEFINGNIEFDSSEKNGTSVFIRIPYSNQ